MLHNQKVNDNKLINGIHLAERMVRYTLLREMCCCSSTSIRCFFYTLPHFHCGRTLPLSDVPSPHRAAEIGDVWSGIATTLGWI